MKNLLLLTTLTFLLLHGSDAVAQTDNRIIQESESATGKASVKVKNAAISVRQTTPLSFGSFSSTSGGIIDEQGTASGGVTSVNKGQAGVFTIEGLSSGNYEVTIPSEATISDMVSGANKMKVKLAANKKRGSLSASGGRIATDNVTVTGTLEVQPNQAVGKYSGTYPVTVNYK